MKLEKAAGDSRPSGSFIKATIVDTSFLRSNQEDLTPLNIIEWQIYWPYSYPIVRSGTYKDRDCCTARDQVYHNGFGLVCCFCRKAWIETNLL